MFCEGCCHNVLILEAYTAEDLFALVLRLVERDVWRRRCVFGYLFDWCRCGWVSDLAFFVQVVYSFASLALKLLYPSSPSLRSRIAAVEASESTLEERHVC